MFKADLIERAAHFRSAQDDPDRKLASCPALVLNADYTPLSYYPLSLWPWQTAIKAIFLDRVTVVESYDREVHSPSLDLKIPSVIALRQYVKPSEFPAFTRFNLFLRDRFTCQYCGSPHNLTFDHVIPRRMGGKTTWENIASACAPCNMKKGGRTPDQAGMQLATQPIRPTHWQLQQYGKQFPPNYLHETWRDWLYWEIELEE
ncbi:HNH endonuclease [Altererythrobacter sp. MF3-039]|uniref:HNH endonuclease n=1 Tax=Altererythrobacter sp. MF3-039 TaxID=3252901 RepID=UPI00390CA033